jgi:glycosyltransferase involved in cell wall biosynthesis
VKVAYWLVCYQHERYVREAVRSALAQDYSPLEILISDDCSTDRTFEIVQEEAARYRGPHAVRLNRNDRNLAAAHYDRLLELTDAGLIVMAHGDDIAEPHRTARLAGALAEPQVFMAASNALLVDAGGTAAGLYSRRLADELLDVREIVKTIWGSNRLGATLALRREVLSAFPPLGRRAAPAGIDIILPFRAGVLGNLRYLAEPLVRYRRHDQNLSSSWGDQSVDEPEYREAMSAYLLRAMHKNLHDLGKYIGARGSDASLTELHTALAQAILTRSALWAKTHNELMLSGRRQRWTQPPRAGEG